MPQSLIHRTLVLLKPDAVQRCIVGNITTRFENAGLKIVGMKMLWADDEFFKKHYFDVEERHGPKVFKINTDYLTSGPVIAFCLEGINAIAQVRKMAGKTNPFQAEVGTIRGDFCHMTMEYANSQGKFLSNLIHSSANAEEAKMELSLWFNEDDFHSYDVAHEGHTQ